MDHLTRPKNPIHPTPIIRMREPVVYDGGDFATYPDRQGWGPRSVRQWLSEFQRPNKSLVAFLERWLLFGPLSIVLSIICDPSDFIYFDGEDPNPIVTTKSLPAALQHFRDVYNFHPFHHFPALKHLLRAWALQDRLLKLDGDWEIAETFLPEVSSLDSFLFFHGMAIRDPRDPMIIMTTSLIMEAMTGVLLPAREAPWKSEVPMPAMSIGESQTGPLWAKLREEGWCPSELSRLCSQFNQSCLYFIYNLQRPRNHESHHMIRIGKDTNPLPPTRLCTPFECTHRALREEEYCTRHADGCEGCDDMVADIGELCHILQRGKIPLILSIDKDYKGSNIMFVEAEPDLAYVAISHVWSDGLGNLQRNALPRCQLLRLSNMTWNLPGKHSNILLFWCDTICVPPDSAGATNAQVKALGQMRNVYAEASAVLVLDSWLFNSPKNDRHHLEILLKIFCCTWNTRLWTYQEGALAKALYFQFRDGPYDIDAGVQELKRATSLTEELIMLQPLVVRHHSLRGFRSLQTRTRGAKLLAIAFELGQRTTSVPTDEPLCLAVLLELDVEELAATEPPLRMQKFWTMLPGIPWSILFRSYHTLSIDGLRWAPATLLRSRLNKVSLLISPNDPEAVRGGRGVFINCPAIRFRGQGQPFRHSFAIKTRNGTWFEAHLGKKSPLHTQGNAGEDSLTPNPPLLLRPGEFAFLLDHMPDGAANREINAIIPSNQEQGQEFIVAILVAIDCEENGTIYTRRIQVAAVERYGPALDSARIQKLERMTRHLNNVEFCGYDEEGGNVTIVAATTTSGQQRWCVG